MLPASYYWPIQDPYHPLNYSWNGCSEIASKGKNTTLIFSFNNELPRNSTLTIVGPSLPFSASDGTIIRNYLENNGTVLLADDTGSGNSLLEELNVSVRFAGDALADLYPYDRNPSFPLVTHFSPGPLSNNVSIVILNHPSFLRILDSSGVMVLASSSPFSFVDMSGNGKPAPNESVNSYPIIAYTHIGNGSLILASNAGMFTNEMIDLHDNMRLFENVARDRGSLLVDVAHLANAPLTKLHLAVKNDIDWFAQSSLYIQAILVILILAAALPIRSLRGRGKVTVRF